MIQVHMIGSDQKSNCLNRVVACTATSVHTVSRSRDRFSCCFLGGLEYRQDRDRQFFHNSFQFSKNKGPSKSEPGWICIWGGFQPVEIEFHGCHPLLAVGVRVAGIGGLRTHRFRDLSAQDLFIGKQQKKRSRKSQMDT